MQKYKDSLKIQKRRKLFFKLVLIFVVATTALSGLFYVLFFGNLLDVRDIVLESPDGLRAEISATTDRWMGRRFLGISPGSNLLFLSAEKLSAHLLGNVPKLALIAVTKKLPHSLLILVEERKPLGIWCLTSQSKCYYFDQTGIAFEEVGPSAGFILTNVFDRRTRSFGLGEKVESDNWFLAITKAKEFLSKINIDVSEIEIQSGAFEDFDVKTKEGWKIILSNSIDIESQIRSLGVFLKEKISPAQRANLQYIDLRIQDRIYYK